ncbi:hypothetical protein ACTTAL_11495 [Rhodobacter capsulatus]|uniref:hypothetical protein n=1 Tax=Rhodobacter capsulatus TaxID=1061 RepID=UPI0003D2E224|nr:hypothetical protein [Rhodobacter capsulatus]ETD89109.1 hypothetical protein U713_10200 [Rhodobacter capsulatus YW2]
MDLDRIVIDLLSDRIVAELVARRRRGLLVFGATDLGLDAALASLATLAKAGWSFEWTAEAALREGLAARLDWPEAAAPVNLSRAALVLVPALNLSLAAKLALGIADDPLSQILTEALDRGRRIVAARDGVCPAARDRLARGLVPATEARRALMRGHLQALAAQGVELGWAATLASMVEGAGAAAAPALQDSGIFGAQDARAVTGARLRLGRAVLLTPAAEDILAARGIAISRG